MGGKFGEFGKSTMIRQTKTIQVVVMTVNNLLADLLICQTFFRQMLKKNQFTKLSHYMVASMIVNNYYLDIREDIGHRSKRKEFGETVTRNIWSTGVTFSI